MENRFGIKDLFLFLFVGALIVLVVLAMGMFDRQYQQILTIKQQNSELTRDVVAIKRQLAEGVVATRSASGGGQAGTQPAGEDAFRLLREAAKKPGFARGDWLIDNFGTKIGKLTPLISTDIYQKWVEYQVMESMAVLDPDSLEYLPRLASRWDVSPDGLRMRFYLRPGVTFSDGEPLDADDVLFTFNWIRNEAVAADRDRAFLTKLKDVTKLDDLTVEFTFSEFYYLNFSTIAGTSIMAEHFYSRFKPQEFNEKTGLLIGSGPYRLQNPETWTPGQPVEIVRNDRYWGEPPTFDRIVYKEIQGESTEMVIYGNQNHDIIRCTPAMYEKLLADQRVMAFSNHLKYPSIYKGFLYCGWNQARRQDGKDVPTLFADKRVRRAMTMLVDRERMAKDIFRDYYTVASGPFAPQSPQSDPNVKAWPYDEAGAKALLKEVGFEDRNRDGVLEGPDGKQQFRFKLVYPSGNESWEKVVLFMKDNYARAGIILEPDKLDWPVMVQRLNEGDFEAITLGWSSSPESDPYQIYHSDAMKGQGDNRTHYSNPELDRTIDQARTTVDKAARMKLWQQVHRILHEDQPYTFLFNRPELRLWNNRIQNVVPSTVGLNYEQLNGGVIPWFVPSDKQRYTQ